MTNHPKLIRLELTDGAYRVDYAGPDGETVSVRVPGETEETVLLSVARAELRRARPEFMGEPTLSAGLPGRDPSEIDAGDE
jgi:hypothetical protein